MFGFGSNKKLAKEIDAGLNAAKAQLALGTKDGRVAAYGIVMPLIEKAQAGKYAEGQMDLFCVLGDVYFAGGDHETALSAYTDAIHVEGALGNDQVHLRLGKAQFELGNMDRAADELTRAMMGGGPEIFTTEDPKYFDYLKTVLDPPPGGWD